MSAFIRRWPAIALMLLAMLFGTAPLLAVNLGLLSEGWQQLGAFSASLAGFVLAAISGGGAAVRELLGRVLIWRVGLRWWLVALFFAAALSVLSLYTFRLLGGPPVDWSGLKPIYTVVPSIVILTFLAGVGEEFGWRGFALPRLQRHHTALWSALVVGVIWGLWHIPLFYVHGTIQEQLRMDAGPLLAIFGYMVHVIASSVQQTWVFNNTKGSVMLAAVFHGAVNAWTVYINIYRGHFEGIFVFAGVSALVSILIVLLAGPEHLSRTTTRNVLPDEAG